MAGITTAVYMCRALTKRVSHVEMIILAKARVCSVIFYYISRACACHLSWGLSVLRGPVYEEKALSSC